MAAFAFRRGGGKSGLHGDTVPGNTRRGRPQGKCHRKQTAAASSGVRVKGCGKSAPRRWRQGRQGKPHREQNQIGTAGRLCAGRRVSTPLSGSVARGAWRQASQMNGHLSRGFRAAGGQNPAYRPSGAFFMPLKRRARFSETLGSRTIRSDARSRLPVRDEASSPLTGSTDSHRMRCCPRMTLAEPQRRPIGRPWFGHVLFALPP